MNKMYKLSFAIISVILLTIVSMTGFSAGENDKKDNNRNELVMDSLDVSGPSNIPEAKKSINRGDIITINARLKNGRSAPSGPYKIRFYLSRSQDGGDAPYEFDVFHDVSLNQSANPKMTVSNQNFDSFHAVSPDQSGGVFITGKYAFPFSMGAGYSYWVVAEVSPEKSIESGENKITRITSIISVPCDQFDSYIDGDTYHCPFKPGKQD